MAPTYHKAFDKGIVYLDVDYTMKPNQEKLGQLKDIGLDGGLTVFLSQLGKIILPVDKNSWPCEEFIKRANGFRQI